MRLLKITPWFSVHLCSNWTFGYGVHRTYMVSPDKEIYVHFIPGILIIVGCGHADWHSAHWGKQEIKYWFLRKLKRVQSGN